MQKSHQFVEVQVVQTKQNELRIVGCFLVCYKGTNDDVLHSNNFLTLPSANSISLVVQVLQGFD